MISLIKKLYDDLEDGIWTTNFNSNHENCLLAVKINDKIWNQDIQNAVRNIRNMVRNGKYYSL